MEEATQVVHAWALKPPASEASEASGSGELMLSAGSHRVMLPREVLTQALELSANSVDSETSASDFVLLTVASDFVLLTVTGMSQAPMLLNSSNSSELLGQPVSVNFRSPSGMRIAMDRLAKPMQLGFDVEEQSRSRTGWKAVCAFWDEEASVWAHAGVVRSEEVADEFICVTSHLTIFGAILERVLLVLRAPLHQRCCLLRAYSVLAPAA